MAPVSATPWPVKAVCRSLAITMRQARRIIARSPVSNFDQRLVEGSSSGQLGRVGDLLECGGDLRIELQAGDGRRQAGGGLVIEGLVEHTGGEVCAGDGGVFFVDEEADLRVLLFAGQPGFADRRD